MQTISCPTCNNHINLHIAFKYKTILRLLFIEDVGIEPLFQIPILGCIPLHFILVVWRFKFRQSAYLPIWYIWLTTPHLVPRLPSYHYVVVVAYFAILSTRGAIDETRTRNILLGRQVLYQLNYYRIYSGFVRYQITTNWLPLYLGTVRFIPQILGRLRRLSELIVFLTYLGICFKTTPIRRIQALIANQVDYEEFLNLISVFQCYSDSQVLTFYNLNSYNNFLTYSVLSFWTVIIITYSESFVNTFWKVF